MRAPQLFGFADRLLTLAEIPQPLDLDRFLPGNGAWEVELGFGKGRYLLQSATNCPDRRFLGIEVAAEYFRRVDQQARKLHLSNLLRVHGEALYLLAAVLPRGFAARVHVYFPDPWPKTRHHKRRLFDPETVDLVVGALAPGGELCFATDFIAYGEWVVQTLADFPLLEVQRRSTPWPDGARTHYEAKYLAEGRPILRCQARLSQCRTPDMLHPLGRLGVLSAVSPPRRDR